MIFDSLRDILEKDVEVVDGDEEFYKFTWYGKKKSKKEAKETTTKTLRPYANESKNWEDTKNIFIEGDNIDALRIMKGPYNGKIKMIYIDPPYNTGKEFIYDDKFAETKEEYLKKTNQLSEDGLLVENAKTNGKNHSEWLNRMYPRLYISRQLLTDDGIIFISIDDNEVTNLRKICDEIFGEQNFLAQIIVEGTPKNDPHIVSTAHEYCLVYVKNFNKAKLSNYGLKNPLYSQINNIFENYHDDFNLVEKKLKEFYEDNDLKSDNIANYKFADENGVFRIGPIDDPQKSGPTDDRINPLTNTPCITPNGGWRCTLDTWNQWIDENLIYFPPNNDKIPSKKTYIDINRVDVIKAYMKIQTRKDTDALRKLFDADITLFPNPKPVELLKMFIDNCNDSEFIVCDFFSGSASTAEAVMKLNAEDGGKRKFILVQYPEEITEKGKTGKSKKIAKAAIKFLKENNKDLTIAEIGKERIRRSGNKIINETEVEDLDVGFRVFKVDESNFIPWNPSLKNKDEIKQAVLGTANNIVQGRSELDLIYELILKLDLDLNKEIEEKQLNNNHYYIVDNGFMIICLEPTINLSITEDIIQLKEEYLTDKCQVVILEKALNNDNNISINISERLESEGIEFYTI